MPCYNSEDEEDDAAALREASVNKILVQKLGAVLCGLVKAEGIDFITSVVNWKETGVTEEYFRIWWKAHQSQDAKRGV